MRESSPNSGDHYIPGGNYAICDECGLQYRAFELKLRWDGLLVCLNDWEPRHPQELRKGITERIGVKYSRPETFNAILNDDCSSETNWTLGDGWTLNSVNYGFDHSSGVNVLDRSVTGLTNGDEYSLQIVTENRTLGTVTVSLLTSVDEDGDLTISTNGQSDITFTAADTTDTIRFTPSTDFDGSVKWVAIYPNSSTVSASDL